MPRKKNEKAKNANVALCYVRLSFTRDKEDANSPDRQRANIQSMCDSKGWEPEWYEDTGGHKSGRKEENRPAWLALKKRLGDPDVVALVANDLSRLHRKGWRVGDLIERLNNLEVALTLAAPGRQQIDTSTQQGRMLVQLGAMFDEYYAEDIAQRARDSVAYRKSRGVTIGVPPFGTIRGEDGYLQPIEDGAWLLPNGTFVSGLEMEPPEEGAIWREYFECARRILERYAEGDMGLERLAYMMNDQGWAFRDRKGNPRPFQRADIRRVVANWTEYGGIVLDRQARDRPAYETYDVDDILFDEERAVFPIELLKRVGNVRQQRSVKPINRGIQHDAHPYPLTALAYCKHCDDLAAQHNNPKLRTNLKGKGSHAGRSTRYRHRAGISCGATNKSVPCEVLEEDFGKLISLLQIDMEGIDVMMVVATQFDKSLGNFGEDTTLEQRKQEAIALCQRRIDAAINLYRDGRMGREEYLHRVETNEREIAHWKARTNETQRLALELTMCADVIGRLNDLWSMADEGDKQSLVRSLFEEIVYDLDTRRIVSFKLKAWADRFIILRHSLYVQDEKIEEIPLKSREKIEIQGGGTNIPHRRLELLSPP